MPDAPGFLAVTSLVTSGSGNAQAIYQEIWDFHDYLAKTYGATRPDKPLGTALAPTRWRVKVAAANLRQGPGTQYLDIGDARLGEVLIGVGARDGWVQTERGWISGGLVEVVT
jgi:uncharacterized protein YraI